MTSYRRGDIVLVLFPDSNLVTAKKRPALIVQADNLQTGLPQVVVAMITSNPSRAGHLSRVVVKVGSEEGKQSGLHGDSVIVTDNLAMVREQFIDKVLGSLPYMKAVEIALAHTFGLRAN